MSNALLLISQQRHRRKTSKQPRCSMCACVCYTEACATVCVCGSCRRSMLAEDAGSSAGKVNWALCWVKAYSVQTKGPIKKKKKKKKPVTGSWKAKHWATVPSSQSQINGMDDHKRWLQANPRHSSWVRSFPLWSKIKTGQWRDDIGRLRTPPPQTRGDAICTQYSHTELYKAGMSFYQQRGKW